MKKIIVIAGTADARKLIMELEKQGYPIIATVATGFGHELLKDSEGVTVREGRRKKEEFLTLIKETEAFCLVDASHPYAAEVSKTAMEACCSAGIPYIRYERRASELEQELIAVKDFEEAVQRLEDLEGNILLTIGSNNLGYFTKLRDYKNRLFVRVLPDSKVLIKCEELGFSASNIFAAKGPFSLEMNIAMIKHCNASVLVTKDSGKEGGVEEKGMAAAQLGIPLMVIARPDITYSKLCHSMEETLGCVIQLSSGNK